VSDAEEVVEVERLLEIVAGAEFFTAGLVEGGRRGSQDGDRHGG
jgi:hypothetical protein